MLLEDKGAYDSMAKVVNPYGEGTTSEHLLNLLREN